MFSPLKLFTIATLVLIASTVFVQDANAQGTSQYEARLQAMQRARARAQQTQQQPTNQRAVQQVDYEYADQGMDYAAPPAPPRDQMTRVARNNRVARRQTPVRRASDSMPRSKGRTTPNNYQPRHLRTAQIYDSPMVSGGAPIVSGSPMMADSGLAAGACASCGGGNCAGCGGAAPVYNEVITDGCVDGGCDAGGCGLGGLIGCGTGCGILGCNDCGGMELSCSERGGCPPGTFENCWIGRLGRILGRGDYFAGAVGFQSPAFTAGNETIHDCNFGGYIGANVGIPLCRITCGLLSGQVGVRHVGSNFNGTSFSPEDRSQTFFTAGVYRRVDYGLQAGLVYDYVDDQWFTESEVSQIRGDIGWVYPGGSTFGFRLAKNGSDDVTNGVVNGNAFTGLTTTSLDWYRFYYRRDCSWGGWTELFAGWTDDDRGMFGLSADMPINGAFAFQSGLTYVTDSDNSAAAGDEYWNLFLGLSLRPSGVAWYKNYDRPMFDVADNGSLLISRN